MTTPQAQRFAERCRNFGLEFAMEGQNFVCLRDDQEFSVAQGNTKDIISTIVAGCANMSIGKQIAISSYTLLDFSRLPVWLLHELIFLLFAVFEDPQVETPEEPAVPEVNTQDPPHHWRTICKSFVEWI